MSESGPFPIDKSVVFRQWKREAAEIALHKWYMSERAGQDVGWEFASWDWHRRYRADWLKAQESGRGPLTDRS